MVFPKSKIYIYQYVQQHRCSYFACFPKPAASLKLGSTIARFQQQRIRNMSALTNLTGLPVEALAKAGPNVSVRPTHPPAITSGWQPTGQA